MEELLEERDNLRVPDLSIWPFPAKGRETNRFLFFLKSPLTFFENELEKFNSLFF